MNTFGTQQSYTGRLFMVAADEQGNYLEQDLPSAPQDYNFVFPSGHRWTIPAGQTKSLPLPCKAGCSICTPASPAPTEL